MVVTNSPRDLAPKRVARRMQSSPHNASRVPAQKASGPREALPSPSRRSHGGIKARETYTREDASALGRTGLRYAPLRSLRASIEARAGREMWSTPAHRGCRCAVPSNRFSQASVRRRRHRGPRCSRRRLPPRRKISKSPGRSMSAGCRGAMPPSSGIVKKWADKYGINIEVKQFNDYVESINQYTAGAFDAVTLTNMDALSIPAAGGVDTTAVIVGDFSNGNDAVILKDKTSSRTSWARTSISSSSPCRTICWRARSRASRRRKGPEGRQHVRRRHGRRLQDARSDGGGDLEADRFDHP